MLALVMFLLLIAAAMVAPVLCVYMVLRRMNVGRMAATTISGGAGAGVFLWVRDFDFFMNPGGPQMPLSRAICDWSGLTFCCCGYLNMYWPPLLLMIAGSVLGLVLVVFIRLVRSI